MHNLFLSFQLTNYLYLQLSKNQLFLMDIKHQQGWFWANLGLLHSKKNSDCNQLVFFLKKDIF